MEVRGARPTWPIVDGEAPRRKAVFLARPEEAEIAGAEEGDQLVEHLRVVERMMEAKARKAQVDGKRPLDAVAAVVEQLPLVGHRGRHALPDHVDGHRALEQESQVEELHAERTVAGREQGLVGPEADVPVVVEAEPVQGLGQLGRGSLEGGPRQLPRPADHILEPEGARSRRSRLLGEGRGGGGRKQALQEGSTGQVHHGAVCSSRAGSRPDGQDHDIGLTFLPWTWIA
jgi:hypothetical protein